MRLYNRISLLVVLLCGTGTSLVAQSVQRGQALFYNGQDQKTPLANVSINAAGAGTVLSDAQGEFELKFRTLHAGDEIRFRRIELYGYEVMNQEALDVARIGRESNDSSRLKIVLAKREYLRQLREGYRSVAAKRYQRQLDEATAEAERLRQEGKLAIDQYNERMNAIEEEYESKLLRLESYIDKFARIDLTELDEQERRITALVQAGDFDAALKMYEDQHLAERLKQSREDKAKLESAQAQIAKAAQQTAQENLRLRASIDRQVTLLRMAGDDANLLKAHQILYQTFLADTTDWQARKEYATSLSNYGKYAEQIQVLNSGIEREPDVVARCLMMCDQMSALWESGQHREAMLLANKCDSLLVPLKDNDYKVMSRALPWCAIYQLQYYVNYGELEAGKAVAEQVRKDWTVDTLSVNSINTHIALSKILTDIYTLNSMHQDALWSARESIALGRLAVKLYPYSRELIYAYASACSTFIFEGLTDEAKESARNCELCMAEQLNKSSMLQTLKQSASAYFSIVEALVSANQYALADSISKSEEKYRVFERLMPIEVSQVALGNVFRLYQSRIWLNTGRVTEAKTLATEAMAALQADEAGADFLPYFGTDIQARIALAEGRLDEAVAHCQQCIDYCQQTYAESQDAWDADNLCRAYLLLAEIHIEAKSKAKAKAAIKQAEKVAAFESDRLYIKQIKTLIK